MFLTIVLLSLTLSIAIGIFNIIYTELLIGGEIRASFYALYASDEIIERTTYLDKVLKVVCSSGLGTNCYTTVTAPASNGACSWVKVTKNFVTRQTEVTGIGQWPCDSTSPLITKRSFLSSFAMHEFEDLSAWWPYNEGAVQVTLDITANANNACRGDTCTPNTEDPAWDGAVFVSAPFALRFTDTDNDRVFAFDSPTLNLTWPISIEAWVCNKVPLNPIETILKKGGGGVTSYGLYVTAAGEMQFEFMSSAILQSSISTGAAIPLDTWNQLIVTYDGVAVRYYKNGVYISGVVQSGSLDSTSGVTGRVRVGLDIDNAARNFSGLIDEVEVFNKTLQQNDITHNFGAYAAKAGTGC
ncbi:MAG: hypothetical protein A3H69_03060 [Candidatus Sungbacteria bacterium RIFCSPLOWO2_02_FULL_47_9]|nr:MAG: hypothetical protein UX72_C0008G0020 [Parcubacteria group bacterium GW2011_GWA2_47_10]OHA09066.1 MAG: hypothetical protein A3H69_03060 [Candidatus Sungbacteria bacterium RIFCSPLOWO2_02_FULL_47_9]